MTDYYLYPGVRTPFAKVDGPLSKRGAIELGVPVVQAMQSQVQGGADLVVWGTVAPNLTYSNLARETWIDAKLDQTVPAINTVTACSTSMTAVFDAAGVIGRGDTHVALCGGVESMSRVQIGLSQSLSDGLRRLTQGKSTADKIDALRDLSIGDIKLFIPAVKNRATGKSMGEHCELMAKEWRIAREDQDRLALESHQKAVAGWESGFFDDLTIEVDGQAKDQFPRAGTSLEKLAKLGPAFDRESGTLTAGNSSPLTDGAAAVWLSTDAGRARFGDRAHVRLVDWEVAAVDVFEEGLLMAPAYAIPKLLARHDLGYDDIGLWEIHEAFSAQVLCHFAALESAEYRRDRVGVDRDFGTIDRGRVNPNGGSVALGHPFGATGARIMSQAAKELAAMPTGTRAIVSVCADGGLGTVALLEAV